MSHVVIFEGHRRKKFELTAIVKYLQDSNAAIANELKILDVDKNTCQIVWERADGNHPAQEVSYFKGAVHGYIAGYNRCTKELADIVSTRFI